MNNYKFIVLDDDPTGVQCIHNLYVYTEWDVETLCNALCSEEPMFFLLTNSRAFSEEKTQAVHKEIAQNLLAASKKSGVDFVLISRGDSTLRGHYPLETDVLRNTIEQNSPVRFAGEILCPFFFEGGRITRDNVHYCLIGSKPVPAGDTEFARDKTFGYRSSDLTEYIEEKTKGAYRAGNVLSVPLQWLRDNRTDSIISLLRTANGRKIIVNSETYQDLRVFTDAVNTALEDGMRFIFRVAASFTRSIICQEPSPLLEKSDLIPEGASRGGLIVVGSHTQKTTAQMASLLNNGEIESFEFSIKDVFCEQQGRLQLKNAADAANRCIANGKTFLIYTERKLLYSDSADKSLDISVKISSALSEAVAAISEKPGFIVVKGGITSNDIALKGLHVKSALVAGQIRPGIPVWTLPADNKFAGVPYIICPGNTGDESLLSGIYSMLK